MPKIRNPRRFTPFVEKPRGWRRDRFVSQRWKILQDPNGRGVYTCHHMMDGGLYDGEIYHEPSDSHWHDFRFISQRHAREGLVYSATIRTALLAAMDWAEEYAWDQQHTILTAEEYAAAHPPLEFVPCGRGLFTLADREEATFERLGGLSAWGVRAKALREAINHVPGIRPQCRLDYSYASGVGAIFITADKKLTIDSLAAFVQDFWRRGEEPYEDEAVDFSSRHPENHEALLTLIDQQAKGWERMDRLARGLETADDGDDGDEETVET